MELLATHINADFDALAAMVAASRLHPGAQMFFPGSREESELRMLESGLVEIAEVKRKDVDPAALTRVILCDVRQRDRIGVVAEWLETHPGIAVWAYDHHPDSGNDVAVSGGLVDPAAGSTSTLLVEEMERRGLGYGAAEANLLLLGLYEDTGSLTHATAGPRDLAAAPRLPRPRAAAVGAGARPDDRPLLRSPGHHHGRRGQGALEHLAGDRRPGRRSGTGAGDRRRHPHPLGRRHPARSGRPSRRAGGRPRGGVGGAGGAG